MLHLKLPTTPPTHQRTVHYRYLDNSVIVNVLLKPANTSRHIQYYTEHIPQIKSEPSNSFRCFLDPQEAMLHATEKNASCVNIELGDAKIIADALHVPLMVTISSYCNLDDQSEIHEVYFWRKT